MRIREILQRVQSLYSKGVQSDDTRLAARHIYSKVLTSRARLIIQKMNKRQKISQWAYQTLDCVELIKALPYECPCLPSVGCVILRTKEELPKPLTGLLDGHMIQSVTSLEGSITMSETTWKEKKYAKGKKYTSSNPDYYIRNNYLYVTLKEGPKVITVTGLFEDPLEVEEFPGICDEGCGEECVDCSSPLDKDLPISKDMVETLIEMTVNELISIFSQGQEDLTNNATDSLKETSK